MIEQCMISTELVVDFSMNSMFVALGGLVIATTISVSFPEDILKYIAHILCLLTLYCSASFGYLLQRQISSSAALNPQACALENAEIDVDTFQDIQSFSLILGCILLLGLLISSPKRS